MKNMIYEFLRYIKTAKEIIRGRSQQNLLKQTKTLDFVPELMNPSPEWFDFIGALHDENNFLLGVI